MSNFSVSFTGFSTQEEAESFVAWFEGQGEQCEGLPIYMEDSNVKYVLTTGTTTIDGNTVVQPLRIIYFK